MNRVLPRFGLVLLFVLCLLAAAGYAWAETPLPQALHQSLDAAGPQAAHVGSLWDVFLALCSFVFVAILAVLLWVLWRRPRASSQDSPDLSVVNHPEPGPRRKVTVAVVASVIGLFALIVASYATDRAIGRLALRDAVNIELTGNQWWWSARYRSGAVSDEFNTANELHIPVGRPVVLTLLANDVIHSFWVPNLSGKKDMIPGRTSVLPLRADRPGVYRGQCAEFCGLQHALMGLVVVAEPAEQFEAWQKAQRAPATPPADPKALHGQSLFQSVSCAMCHAIQGTQAQGQRGPDLTHVASRQTLAAGTLKNTREDLASWIADPQKHKPGTNMPATPLSPGDLDAIVTYLGTLK